MRFLVAFAVLLSCTVAHAKLPPWSERELRVLQSLSISSLNTPPLQPSNAYADNPQAAVLGATLFFDKQLSANGQLSCASCHDPALYFTDGKKRGVGVNQTGRNTMTIVGAAYQRWFYWDGRRDSLWSQALIPFEAPDEMGSSRTALVKHVTENASYKEQYLNVFGEFPKDLNPEALPIHAGPLANEQGRDAWHKLPHAQQRKINLVYANLGKSIAAYERTLRYKPSRFDRYVAELSLGKISSQRLSNDEKKGARLFINSSKTQCLQCHNGPTFSNGDFHNIGTGNFSGEHLDFGRVFGVQAVLMDEFNCLGAYSDAPKEQCSELRFLKQDAHVPLEGSYKTPSLRNVAATAPYFHDGSKANLEDVLAHYNSPPNKQHAGAHELRKLALSATEIEQLRLFLLTLSEE